MDSLQIKIKHRGKYKYNPQIVLGNGVGDKVYYGHCSEDSISWFNMRHIGLSTSDESVLTSALNLVKQDHSLPEDITNKLRDVYTYN